MYNSDDRPLSAIAEEIENSLVKVYNEQLTKRIELSDKKEECYQRYREANEMGDRSENAPLEEAIRSMKETNLAIRVCEDQLSRLRNIDDLNFRRKINDNDDLSQYRGYNSTGVIAVYSTVRLEKQAINGEDAELFIFRIYPNNISNPDIGVMAANTNLAIALMGKVKGDLAIISSGPFMLQYKILEVF